MLASFPELFSNGVSGTLYSLSFSVVNISNRLIFYVVFFTVELHFDECFPYVYLGHIYRVAKPEL